MLYRWACFETYRSSHFRGDILFVFIAYDVSEIFVRCQKWVIFIKFLSLFVFVFLSLSVEASLEGVSVDDARALLCRLVTVSDKVAEVESLVGTLTFLFNSFLCLFVGFMEGVMSHYRLYTLLHSIIVHLHLLPDVARLLSQSLLLLS